jgi:hypothetical protein
MRNRNVSVLSTRCVCGAVQLIGWTHEEELEVSEENGVATQCCVSGHVSSLPMPTANPSAG